MNSPRRLRPERASPRIEAEAAAWLARRDAGLSAGEDQAWRAWLAADPCHGACFDDLAATWTILNAPRTAGRGNALVHAAEQIERNRRQRRRRTAGFALAGLAAAAALILGLRLLPSGPASRGNPVTAFAVRSDRQLLADGSVVELAADAEVTVDYTPGRRSVRLVRGEAHFVVARDPARPFVVSAGPIDVKAVGTEFAVRFGPREVAVLVTEGRVAVEREPAAVVASRTTEAAPTLVAAGNRLVVPADEAARPLPSPQAISAGEIAQALAWRHQRVEFNATTLAEAVALLNARNPVKLELADADTAALRITGVFWANDPAGFGRLVEASLGLKSTRGPDGTIVLGRVAPGQK